MNIDERIEALTQSVELLSHMHQDNEKRYAKLFERHDKLFERQDKLFERLGRIAEIHEDRIRDLEQGNG